jgi:hypothetical protein
MSEAAPAFSTPTIVHFCAVLFLSAVLRAPWDSVVAFAAAVGAIGLAGIAYVIFVARRIYRQKAYTPDAEDWWCHIGLPFLAYAAFAGSAYVALSQERVALFLSGGASLLLLFTAIHNAWDAGAYHVIYRRPPADTDAP